MVFTTIGIYKGERVAIKKITKKKVVDVTKKLLWEIKQVRDVTSENTVRYLSFHDGNSFSIFCFVNKIVCLSDFLEMFCKNRKCFRSLILNLNVIKELFSRLLILYKMFEQNPSRTNLKDLPL